MCGSQGLCRLRERLRRARASSPATWLARAGRGAARRAADRASASRSCAPSSGATCAFLRRRFAEEGIDIGKSTSQVMPVMVNNDTQGLRGGREDPGARPVPAARDLPGGAQAQVAAAHLRLGRPHRGGARAGGADRSPACCARRGFAGHDPLRLPRTPSAASSSSRPRTRGASCRRHLEPVELHHGTSIFSMTAFDFNESEVGDVRRGRDVGDRARRWCKPGERLPKSAFYPVPGGHHHQGRARARHRALAPAALDGGRGDRVRAREGPKPHRPGRGRTARRWPSSPSSDHSWQPVSHLYQSFMKDDAGAYLANITMEGEQSEHEEETGRIVLHEHPFNKDLVDRRGLRHALPRAVDAERLPDLRSARADRGDARLAGAGLRRLQPALGQGAGRPVRPAGARRPESAERARARPHAGSRATRSGSPTRGDRDAASAGSSRWAATAPGATSANAILQARGVPAQQPRARARAAPAATSPSPSASRRATSRPRRPSCCAGHARAIDVGRIEGRHFLNIVRLRLRRGGARGLLERDVPRGRAALPLLRAAAARLLPGLRGRGRGRRSAPGRARAADADRGQRAVLRRRASRSRPAADLGDGRLDVVRLRQHGPRAAGSTSCSGCCAGRHAGHRPQVETLAARRASVCASTSRRPTRPTASGTARPRASSRSRRCPRALRVLVPARVTSRRSRRRRSRQAARRAHARAVPGDPALEAAAALALTPAAGDSLVGLVFFGSQRTARPAPTAGAPTTFVVVVEPTGPSIARSAPPPGCAGPPWLLALASRVLTPNQISLRLPTAGRGVTPSARSSTRAPSCARPSRAARPLLPSGVSSSRVAALGARRCRAGDARSTALASALRGDLELGAAVAAAAAFDADGYAAHAAPGLDGEGDASRADGPRRTALTRPSATSSFRSRGAAPGLARGRGARAGAGRAGRRSPWPDPAALRAPPPRCLLPPLHRSAPPRAGSSTC